MGLTLNEKLSRREVLGWLAAIIASAALGCWPTAQSEQVPKIYQQKDEWMGNEPSGRVLTLTAGTVTIINGTPAGTFSVNTTLLKIIIEQMSAGLTFTKPTYIVFGNGYSVQDDPREERYNVTFSSGEPDGVTRFLGTTKEYTDNIVTFIPSLRRPGFTGASYTPPSTCTSTSPFVTTSPGEDITHPLLHEISHLVHRAAGQAQEECAAIQDSMDSFRSNDWNSRPLVRLNLQP